MSIDIGSLWQNKTCFIYYRIIAIANTTVYKTLRDEFPPTVVYQNINTKEIFSRPINDFISKNKPLELNQITVEEFKTMIFRLCEMCGYSISHEDHQGAFLIENFDKQNIDSFMNAIDMTKPKTSVKIGE